MTKKERKISKQLADSLRYFVKTTDFDSARDLIDAYTGGELDCLQLDLLTDWVLHGKPEKGGL